ncbi:MAG: hypothetical protein ACR2OZ_17400 [Verrucomicrobiales bacterium]
MSQPKDFPDQSRLRELACSDRAAREVFAFFTEQSPDQTDISVHRAIEVLRAKKLDPSRKRIRTLFERLAKLSLGRYIIGRRGMETRFVCNRDFTLERIGELALASQELRAGVDQEVENRHGWFESLSSKFGEGADETDEGSNSDEQGSAPAVAEEEIESISAAYPLRRNCTIEFQFPADMTQLEAQRLGDFVRTLFYPPQGSDRLSDDEMMAIAAVGARAWDQREAAYATRKAR